MANPIAYTTSPPPTGSLKLGKIAIGVDGLDYGANPGGLTWTEGISTTGSYLIYSDSYSQGLTTEANAYLMAWGSADKTPEALLDTINALPERATASRFDSLPAAMTWLYNQGYYTLSDQPVKNTVTDGLVLSLDAGLLGSYPTTGSGWYQTAGTNYNLTPEGLRAWYNEASTDTQINSSVISGSSGFLLQENTQTYQHGMSYRIGGWTSVVSGSAENYSCYVKSYSGDRYFGFYFFFQDQYCFFDIENGTVYSNSYPAYFTPSIEPAENGWYRCSVQVNQPTTQTLGIFLAMLSKGTPTLSYTGNGTSGVYIAAPQRTLGETLLPFSGVRNSTLINGPIFRNGKIQFDGVDDYVNLSGLLPLGDDVTMLFWASGSFAGTYPSIFSRNSNNNVGGPKGAGTSQAIARDGWHQVGYKWSGSASYFVIDGEEHLADRQGIFPYDYPGAKVLFSMNNKGVFQENDVPVTSFQLYSSAASGTPNFVWQDRDNKVLGVLATSSNRRYYNEAIGATQMYNRALTTSEVKQTYYQAPIVTDGLVLALDAGNLVSYENGSTTTYSLTGSYSGTLQNGVGYSSNNGGTWVFDGVDDSILATGLASQTISEGSFFFWSTCNSTSLYQSPMGWHRSSWSLRTAQTYLYLGWGNTENSVGFSSTGTDWRHLGVTISNGTATFYLNGIPIGTRTGYPSTTTAPTSIYLGRRNHPDGYWYNGNITAAQVYYRELSAQEVQQNYNAQRLRFGL